MTTIADTFNRANEAPLATSSDGTWSWTDVTGTSSVASNKAVVAVLTMLARAQVDLAGDDHEVHADFHTFSNIGICARFAAAAQTFYLLQCANSTTLQMYKCVAGSFTQLGSNATISTVAGDTIKLQCNADDSIVGSQNGSAQITVTSETSITGNTRTGLRGDAGSATWDNFGAADVSAGGGTRPVKMAGEWGGYAGPSGGFAG